MPLLDLTHAFTPDTPVFPGDPKPEIAQSAFLETHGFNDFTLPAADVLIVENGTNFEKLLDVPNFEVIAPPPFFETEAAPVRLVARI